jgi:hypothetical protein
MHQSPPTAKTNGKLGVTIGHIDDAASMHAVCTTLAALHGDSYTFRVTRWQGSTELTALTGRHRVCFVMQADGARVHLAPGQRVRGIPPNDSFQRTEEHWAEVTAATEQEIWSGDVIGMEDHQVVTLSGSATCFEVTTEATNYPLPTVAFLRHLSDRPGGCAAYPGAFRREALPPMRALMHATGGAADQRGVNRVNEHTLDMRFDRDPRPQPHHHGPVAIGEGNVVNHSETALVLPRALYNLPPVGATDTGRVVIYGNPTADPSDTEIISVRPGAVVVTPAANMLEGGIAGHCFENAFAMLVAIPGFVSPHYPIDNRGIANAHE